MPTERRRLRVQGVVQGVGFRPFVYRLAREMALGGFVTNDADGVLVEVEGAADRLDIFVERLTKEQPPQARIDVCRRADLTPTGDGEFRILASRREGQAATLIPPDLAVCDDCLQELFDPADRRYRYPFINCTNCGPRYTIVERVPYDRPYTSMGSFTMCEPCAREYHDPGDRRFHAQPVACPQCGPKLTWQDGRAVTEHPLQHAIDLLQRGGVLALRGLGGFHLAVDARQEAAVKRLRERKGRAEKPLALMARDLATVHKCCNVAAAEADLLQGTCRPIVLLERTREAVDIAPSVAFDNRYFGFMLPYTPLHHLLCEAFEVLVMTSGNLSEEPIAIGNEEALRRLGDIADGFLLHDREILQRCDDSIIRVAGGRRRLIRRARGFVPEPVYLDHPVAEPILACGGELKSTIAVARKDQVFFSQHIGDLDNPLALGFFEECVAHLEAILDVHPRLLACDLHPEYLSTKWARAQSGRQVMGVQHHHAHLVAAMAEHGVTEKTIGIILDGTGYGTDGTIWGGEVLVGDAIGFERFAWLDPVPLPGGTAAIRHPWRMALSYLRYAYGEDAPARSRRLLPGIDAATLDTVFAMMEQGINSPLTSSCGRLFDGVAALLGICSDNAYEAQAAIALEMEATGAGGQLAFNPSEAPWGKKGSLDFRHLVRQVVERDPAGRTTRERAAGFHVLLAELFIGAVLTAREDLGITRVALSGGVYQNVPFLEYMVQRLQALGFLVVTHSDVPTNDGGLALGQVLVADTARRGDT